MEVDSKPASSSAAAKEAAAAADSEDLTAVMSDASFLEGVLNKLPGVDSKSDLVKQAIDAYTSGGAKAVVKQAVDLHASAEAKDSEKEETEQDKKKKKTEEGEDKKE